MAHSADLKGPGGSVVMAFHDAAAGGAIESVLRAVPPLEERGWRFAFWVPSPGPVSERLALAGRTVAGGPRGIEGYSLKALRHPPGARIRLASAARYMSDFRRFLRVQQPDLVHANSLYTFAEALVARSTGLPAFLHVHEMMPANWKSPAAVTIAGRLGIDLVAVSLASGEPLRRGGRFPLIVHESAPVPELARPAPSGDAPLVVGSVGVISRRKGSDIFVEAARQVLEQRDDVTFRLVGRYPDSPEAPWAEAVLNRARAIGITHIPHVDVYEELRRWDIFALASRRDPFPLVVLEAMATGLPVVASASDGIVEQLEPSCGVLVPPDDASELARGIIDLVDRGPARRAAMGRAARQRVADHFTPEHQARELERAYLAVIDRS